LKSANTRHPLDLRIGIDARYLGRPVSGIERYTLNLLAGIAEARPGYRIVVLAPPGAAGSLPASESLEIVPLPGCPRSPADQFSLPWSIRRLGLRLLHCPDSFAPLASPCRTLVTLHDLISVTCRDMLVGSAKSRWFRTWRAWLWLQCRAACGVVTVSQHSAGDIRRLLSVPEAKIHVIHNGVRPPQARPLGESPAPWPATGRLLVYVGRLDPYKNLVGLVRALAIIRRQAGEEVHLVVAGEADERYPQARQEAESLGVREATHFVGHLSDAQMPALYQSAAALVFPSFYEGFGLPPVEAMAYGVPVVSSDRTAMPEILGQAALYADPADPASIAAAVLRILGEPALADRLRLAGPIQAAQYSLLRSAIAHLELYERVVKM
jgi:glycosyltransferase involved in cell wall biosynthesis